MAGLGGILKKDGLGPGGKSDGIATDPLIREVPQPLIEQLEKLKAHFKEMRMHGDSFKSAVAEKASMKLNEELSHFRAVIHRRRVDLSSTRSQLEDMHAVRRNYRILCLMTRDKDPKSRTIANDESWEYMLQELSSKEKTILGLQDQLARLERIALSATNESAVDFSRKELETHLERFDEIFNTVAMEVSELRERTADTKQQFLEFLRRIHGPYAPNPFAPRRDNRDLSTSLLNDVEPFPTVSAVMQYRDVLSKLPHGALPQPATAAPFGSMQPAGSLFGSTAPRPGGLFGSTQPAAATGGSLFGSATATKPTSLFGPTQPSSAPVVAGGSLFAGTSAKQTPGNLFGTPQPSTSTATVAPLFGTTPAASSSGNLFGSTQQSATPAFGSTLNTSSSGTLFGGTASKQQAFFGK